MIQRLPRIDWRKAAATVAPGVLLLCASLANFLRHSGYPYFRLDVALVVAGFVLVSVAMALVYSGQRQWGRSVLEGLLVALFVELNTSSFVLGAVAGVLVAAFTWTRKTSLMSPMAVMGLVVLVTTLLGIGGGSGWITSTQAAAPPATRSDTPKSAVLHIILDEHIGIEGLPEDNPGSIRLADELRSFYREHGLTLYGRAYSEHLHTVNAIPYILNYGRGVGQSGGKSGVVVGPTAHLQSLADRGYRLKILQSDFAEFCSGAAFSQCTTYDSSSLRPTLAVPLTTAARSGLIATKFVTLSPTAFSLSKGVWIIFRLLSRAGVRLAPPNLDDSSRSSTVAALAAIDMLERQLRYAQPGDAYFAHILMPHYPYVVASDCSYLPWSEWGARAGLARRQQAYFDQIRCTTRKVDLLLRAISSSPAGDNAIVIIHGDHGSRITKVDPGEHTIGEFDAHDMIAGYSTLFAIRAPGLRPLYFDRPQPASGLLSDFTASGFRSAPRTGAADRRGVILDDRAWTPRRRVNLPPDW